MVSRFFASRGSDVCRNLAGEIFKSRLRVGLDRIKPFVLKLSIFFCSRDDVYLPHHLACGSNRFRARRGVEWGVGDRLHALGL